MLTVCQVLWGCLGVKDGSCLLHKDTERAASWLTWAGKCSLMLQGYASNLCMLNQSRLQIS